MPNIDRLEAVLEHITLHPESHNQSKWNCGTAACFAGWTVRMYAVEDGWSLALDEQRFGYFNGSDNFYGNQQWARDGISKDISSLAAHLLGMPMDDASRLFSAGNSLSMIASMVKDIANTGGTRRWDAYHDEYVTELIDKATACTEEAPGCLM